MSYCRWSSDNWQCDLYCYEDVSGGWTTHVAGRRKVGDIPIVDWSLIMDRNATEENIQLWSDQYAKQQEFLDGCEHEDIGLPYDGESFNDATLEKFRDRVVMLQAAGYNVPDYVLEEIDAEITEQQ